MIHLWLYLFPGQTEKSLFSFIIRVFTFFPLGSVPFCPFLSTQSPALATLFQEVQGKACMI